MNQAQAPLPLATTQGLAAVMAQLESQALQQVAIPAGSVPARLVEYSRRRWLAVPPHTTLEIVEDPRVVAVPGMPYYGYGLMQWQNRWIALIHLDSLIRAFRSTPELPPLRYALVLAYQATPLGPVAHGAVALMSRLPHVVPVHDGQACPLPADSDIWPRISLSCFEHDGQAVPVVDTARLFGTCHD